MNKSIFPLMTVAVLALSACTPEPAPIATQVGTPTDTGSTATTAQPTQTIQSPTPTQPPPTPTTKPAAECPGPTEGTRLLMNEVMGYCLLYPDELNRLDPYPAEACLVPEGPTMLCHNAHAFFEVTDAAGRNVSQVADELTARLGFNIERSSLTIAGEQAVAIDGMPAQASMRVVLLVHDDRLYTLSFVSPDAEDSSGIERFERLYTTVIDSFTLVPIVPPPASTETSLGTAVVVFVKEGNILVWEEATGQTQTIFDSGDVIRVELSHDGQLVAFSRRINFEGGGSEQHLETALWIARRNGEDPREIVSAGELRARLGASETENVELPCLEWVPNSHRLLYSGLVSPPYIGGRCFQVPTRGVYLLDADTLASAELAPAEESVVFVPSPDGELIALVSSTGPYFVNVEGSLSGQAHFTRPAGGVPGPYGDNFRPYGPRAWTQDSSALLIRGSSVYVGNATTRFTIWRVPADGAPAQPLVTLRGDAEQLAPDGSVLAFVRGSGPEGVSARFVVPLPDDLGPLAILRDPLGLSWSPDSAAYVLGGDEMFPLCPNAAQAIEVCGPPVRFSEPIQSLEWIDRSRFLYVTYVPRRLVLGSLDGATKVIAEDPQHPLSFAAVASTCRDDSEFVSDVTVPDGTSFAPNTLIRKTWQIRNNGSCAWDTSYRLTFLSGDRMSGPRSAPLGEAVQPGEEVDLSVTLIAPETAGTYQGQWQLFAPDGKPFGTAPYVVIQVP